MGVTSDLKLQGYPLFWLKRYFKVEARFRCTLRQDAGLQQSFPDHAIKTFVWNRDRLLSHARFEVMTAPFTGHSSDLENVGKVSVELNADRNLEAFQAVVYEEHLLAARVLPQES